MFRFCSVVFLFDDTMAANRAPEAAATRVPGFVSKAFEIFSDGQQGGICGWGREGKTVVVRRIAEFENTV